MDGEVESDGRPKVLIVDDEPVIARTLALILNQNGFRALAIYRPWAAVQIAEGLQPDVLLTDLYMPEMDGLEVAARVCAAVPQCRVFLLTAQLRAIEKVREFRARGFAAECLHKPIHPLELLQLLRSAVGCGGHVPGSTGATAETPPRNSKPPA